MARSAGPWIFASVLVMGGCTAGLVKMGSDALESRSERIQTKTSGPGTTRQRTPETTVQTGPALSPTLEQCVGVLTSHQAEVDAVEANMDKKWDLGCLISGGGKGGELSTVSNNLGVPFGDMKFFFWIGDYSAESAASGPYSKIAGESADGVENKPKGYRPAMVPSGSASSLSVLSKNTSTAPTTAAPTGSSQPSPAGGEFASLLTPEYCATTALPALKAASSALTFECVTLDNATIEASNGLFGAIQSRNGGNSAPGTTYCFGTEEWVEGKETYETSLFSKIYPGLAVDSVIDMSGTFAIPTKNAGYAIG